MFSLSVAGSNSLVLKAKGFKAVNIGLLGDSKRALSMLRLLTQDAAKANSEEMQHFFHALRVWLKNQQKYAHQNGTTNIAAPIQCEQPAVCEVVE